MTTERIDPLAVKVFEAYSRNSGNPPDCHFDRSAAEQWMAQALTEAGVAELVSCFGDARDLLDEIDKGVRVEHAKNGYPQSRSVAGIVSERLSAALAPFGRQG